MPQGAGLTSSRFRRVAETGRASVAFSCDGEPVQALEGDTLLTALRLAGRALRRTEFSGETRAGFCLMQACNDCLLWTDQGERLRACATPVAQGLAVFTQPPEHLWPRPIS